MNTNLSWPRASLVAAAILLLGAGFLLAQGRHRDAAHAGPWRVVISKPVVGLGWNAESLYREHEYLGAMFNELDRDGLQPVLWQVMTDRAKGLAEEDRLLVLCRPK